MGFCFLCGARLETVVPPGEHRSREACPDCGRIHYHNPRILVGVFLHHEDKLLWIRRGTEPNKGRWTFPAGFLEHGESLQAAAARELFEETRISIAAEKLVPFSLLSLIAPGQVYVSFHCKCDEEIPAQCTVEVEDWGWFSEAAAPWSELAYPGVEAEVHKTYFWLREGRFPFRIGEMGQGGIHFIEYIPDP